MQRMRQLAGNLLKDVSAAEGAVTFVLLLLLNMKANCL
jgi:hypothetical protein